MANRQIWQLNTPGQLGTPTQVSDTFYLVSQKPDGTEEPVKLTIVQLIGLMVLSSPVVTALQAAQDNAVVTVRGGISSALDTLNKLYTAIIDGAPTAGNSLNKVYNLAVNAVERVDVVNIAARDALNAKVGLFVFVQDDGDGNWALYRANTAGVGATYTKLSDPDSMNAVMTAAQIAASYESNPDTNKFTNAYKALLDTLPPDIILNGDVDPQYLPDVNFNPDHFELITYGGTPNVLSIKQSLIDQINSGSGGGTSGIDTDYMSLPKLASVTAFTATPISASQVNLAWTNNAATGVQNLIVQRKVVGQTTWTTIATLANTAVAYSDNTTIGTTDYNYRVKPKGDGLFFRDGEWVFQTATTPASGGGGAVLRRWYANFNRDVQSPKAPAPWNNSNSGYQSWLSAGGISIPNMATDTGAASTVSIANIDGTSVVDVGFIVINTSGPDVGVWPDTVIISTIRLAEGGVLRVSGVDNTKKYKVYAHFDIDHFDPQSCHMTIGGVSTPARAEAGNHGEGGGSGLANTALNAIDNIIPAGGAFDIIFHIEAGSTKCSLTSIVIEEHD